MPDKPYRPCRYPGCRELTREGFCEKHMVQGKREEDQRRGTAYKRGYDSKWNQYSKRFLKQPGHQLCVYRFPGCSIVAQCVDHRIPPKGKSDPMFWNKDNHVPSCIHCNSVKGNRMVKKDGTI